MSGLLPFLTLIKIIALVSIWCCAVNINSIDNTDIFHFMRKMSVKWPWYFRKPFIECVNCMASFHSLLILSAIFYLKEWPSTLFVQTWIPVVVCCSFTNGIVYLIHESLSLILEHFYSKINKT